MSKIRHFLNTKILLNMYYLLIYPYLTYGSIVWGNTYSSTTKPLFVLQKKAVRLLTFSGFYEHTNELFIRLELLKFYDLVFLYTALFMFDFHKGNLPSSFENFFIARRKIHSHNTSFASRPTFSLPSVRTNYGKFNIRYVGASMWNKIDEHTKSLDKVKFKNKLKINAIDSYIRQ